jgi:hypothetical protein
MSARGITRRSLLAAAAGAAAGGLARAPGASALAELAALDQLVPALPAGAGQPPIIAREAWAQGGCTPRVAPAYGAVELAFVHHTENPNGYSPGEVAAMLRSIFFFHRDGRGWNDIGYNFVVDRFGRIFEARAGGVEEPVIGAQAGGYNYRSTGVAVLGEYGALQISDPARSALARLLAWKLSLHGVPIEGRVTVRVDPAGAVYSRFPANSRVSLPRVAGHRDADSTNCPGDALYGELASIRAAAARLQGRPARLTLLLEPPQAGQPGSAGATQREVGRLVGRLAFLDDEGGIGRPIGDVPIELQAREVRRRGELVRERTLARAQTAADGSWSLALYEAPAAGESPKATVWLRALCPGARGVPAAVSEPLRVTGAVSFAPASPPASPPAPATGAPPPANGAPTPGAPSPSAPAGSAPGATQ